MSERGGESHADKIGQLFDRSGIDPDNVEKIERVNVWQGFIKNEEGNIETTDLVGVQYKPKQEEVDIESLLVRRAPQSRIIPSRRVRPQGYERSFLVGGDAQIPFHDPRAMELFLTINAEKKPEEVNLVGDMVDLAPMGRWEVMPDWVGTTQESIDYYYDFLAQLRADNPNGKITVVHGNHEQRMDTYIRKNAAEILGLRRARAEKELGVLTLQYLARYDELGINAVDGYPNGTYYPEGQESLKFIHGTNTKKGGSNAAKYLAEERESTIYGHTHRQELAYRTFATKLGSVTLAAASPGALCMTDGSVPGFHYTRASSGEVVKKAEDWQQGIIYGHYVEGQDTPELEPSLFTERGVRIEGKRYNV